MFLVTFQIHDVERKMRTKYSLKAVMLAKVAILTPFYDYCKGLKITIKIKKIICKLVLVS